jgi:Tfp pilus assembly protein PilN
MTEINFLSSRTRHKQKQREQDKKLFKISSIVLAVVIIILLIAVGLKLVINLKIKDKTKTIAELKKTIVEQEGIELSYLIFVNKLRAVGEIYAARSDKQTAMIILLI